MTATKSPLKANSQRQKDYVSRMREAGHVSLSSVFVPRVIANECRELVRNHVANWESKQTKQF